MSTSTYLLIAAVLLLIIVSAGGVYFFRNRKGSGRDLPAQRSAELTGLERSESPESPESPEAVDSAASSHTPAPAGSTEHEVADPAENTQAAQVESSQETSASHTGGSQAGAIEDDDAIVLTPLEVPESVPSRMQRLRGRLARSGGLGKGLLAILSRSSLSAGDWEELEDTLLVADIGLEASTQIIDSLKTAVQVEGAKDMKRIRELLARELLAALDPEADRSLHLDAHPASVLMVGVNGTGKTTTVGKLARIFVSEGKTVVMGAADTFRAAAADQLTTWGQRVGARVVRADREGADPASVAFDAVKVANEEPQADVVLVDTAGRLHNKAGLMDELAKIKRVMERFGPINEVLLVLDATTGQNGLGQARAFAQAADITGIVLTKLDGSAKGGIVIAVQKELGVPVKFIGLGEGPDDLAPFDPRAFVDEILG